MPNVGCVDIVNPLNEPTEEPTQPGNNPECNPQKEECIQVAPEDKSGPICPQAGCPDPDDKKPTDNSEVQCLFAPCDGLPVLTPKDAPGEPSLMPAQPCLVGASCDPNDPGAGFEHAGNPESPCLFGACLPVIKELTPSL